MSWLSDSFFTWTEAWGWDREMFPAVFMVNTGLIVLGAGHGVVCCWLWAVRSGVHIHIYSYRNRCICDMGVEGSAHNSKTGTILTRKQAHLPHKTHTNSVYWKSGEG